MALARSAAVAAGCAVFIVVPSMLVGTPGAVLANEAVQDVECADSDQVRLAIVDIADDGVGQAKTAAAAVTAGIRQLTGADLRPYDPVVSGAEELTLERVFEGTAETRYALLDESGVSVAAALVLKQSDGYTLAAFKACDAVLTDLSAGSQ